MATNIVIRNLNLHTQFVVTSYLVTIMFCVLALSYLMITSKQSIVRTSFILVQSVTIFWLLFLLLEWVSFTPKDILTNIRISLICLNFIAPLWLIAKLLFMDSLSKKSFWLIPLILVIPVVLSTLLLFPESSDIFKLYIKDFQLNELTRTYYLTWGSLEKFSGIYSIFCIFLCFLAIIEFFKENNSIKQYEKIAAVVIMWTPIAAHYLGYYLKAPFDFKPLAFSMWGVITVYLASHWQYFNAVPSLVWNVFDVTKEGMVVISMDGSIKVNKSFLEMFDTTNDGFTDFLDDLYPGLSGYIAQKQEIIGLEAKKEDSYYEISIKNVLGRKNKITGQLITINDISTPKQLTLEKERARISMRLHDNMGNRLIALINNLTIALIQPMQAETRLYVDRALSSATASLMTLRKIVEGLSPVNFQETDLIPLIKSVIDRISASGTCVDLQLSGDLESLPPPHKELVYNACQEAMTNSIIHGKAENIIIKLVCDDYSFKMDIVDNGQGSEKICKNNGLINMESSVHALDGKISFGSPSLGGFGIHAKIPIKAGGQG